MKPRPIRVEGDVAYVPLTRGKVAVIDAAAVPLVERHNWQAVPNGGTWYASRAAKQANGKPTTIPMHSVLTGWALCDHWDGDGLNNKRLNLREVTHSQNMMNRRKVSNKHGFKGVGFSNGRKASNRAPYAAQIQKDKAPKIIGWFNTPREAAIAYDAEATKLFGEYAATNKMLGLL